MLGAKKLIRAAPCFLLRFWQPRRAPRPSTPSTTAKGSQTMANEVNFDEFQAIRRRKQQDEEDEDQKEELPPIEATKTEDEDLDVTLAERAGAFAELPEVQLLLCVAILVDVAGASVTAARDEAPPFLVRAAAAFPGFANFLFAFELLALTTAFKLRILTHPGLLLDVCIVAVRPASPFVSGSCRVDGVEGRRPPPSPLRCDLGGSRRQGVGGTVARRPRTLKSRDAAGTSAPPDGRSARPTAIAPLPSREAQPSTRGSREHARGDNALSKPRLLYRRGDFCYGAGTSGRSTWGSNLGSVPGRGDTARRGALAANSAARIPEPALLALQAGLGAFHDACSTYTTRPSVRVFQIGGMHALVLRRGHSTSCDQSAGVAVVLFLSHVSALLWSPTKLKLCNSKSFLACRSRLRNLALCVDRRRPPN